MLLAIIFASWFVTLFAVFLGGILVFKTRYQGETFWKAREKPGDAFVLPDEFEETAEPMELPEEVEAANEAFVHQFNKKLHQKARGETA
jgi:hypothetical protein